LLLLLTPTILLSLATRSHPPVRPSLKRTSLVTRLLSRLLGTSSVSREVVASR
jgi:hypothetical protein